MSDDHEAQWLRDRMQELRQRRNASAPTFEQVWGVAREQQASLEGKPVCPSWSFAAASIAAILLTASVAFHTAAEREHSRQKEREFAAVDGVLITYWQAPSDDLLSIGNSTDLSNL